MQNPDNANPSAVPPQPGQRRLPDRLRANCQSNEENGHHVVLVHGLMSHPLLMTVLARALRRAGFPTENWGYESLLRPIEKPGKRLAERLIELQGRLEVQHIHLVGYSMGSVLVRYALTTGHFSKLRRVAMLAPPNQGSPLARFAAPLLGKVFPPLRQLSDSPQSWIRTLGDLPTHIQVAVIAARYDLLVPVEATRLPRPLPLLVVPTTHVGLLFRKDVAEQVIHFLRTGQFVATE